MLLLLPLHCVLPVLSNSPEGRIGLAARPPHGNGILWYLRGCNHRIVSLPRLLYRGPVAAQAGADTTSQVPK